MSRIQLDPNSDIGRKIIKYDAMSDKMIFTSRELEIIQTYTEASDMFLYTAMYGIKDQDSEKYKTFKKHYQGCKNLLSLGKLITLNNIIHNSKVKDELVLFRGTKDANFRDVTIIEGDIVTFIPPTSTTLSKKTAYDYISQKDPLLIEIHLPIKYNALWLKPFSLYPIECEFLLASFSQFKIEEITEEFVPHQLSKKIILKGILPINNTK